ncbi:hypothetical protein [Microvirgula aerodenitrificans]|uniref:hypothetical protein n=1 Tax=Microvirgula aerodenitrificans TaxID=57480 RepID=UPI00248DFB8F|nr:hypothetical protein [Microvirgula aerodenitrificans]
MNIKSRFACCLLLITLFSPAYAKVFTPPGEISYMGKTYKLAYENSAPNGRAIFEYTTDNEPIEKWSSLITLNYSKSLIISPQKWAEATKASSDRQIPKPHYDLYLKGNNGYARLIFEPDSKNPAYESNVHKSFHLQACNGLLVFQYAKKYPQGAELSPAEKLATLKQIATENTQFAASMEKSEWSPDCK